MAYDKLLQIIQEFGYALVDIVSAVSGLVAKLDVPEAAMSYLMDKLSNVEYRLSKGTSEKLQLGAFVGMFFVLREMLTT